jgi:phenylalanyl-tRNA synthetase alpha chain
MLYTLANRPGGFKPTRMFSIDRVFRNETVDATHLAEFHQVEGVIADYGLTLGDLIGFMSTFFAKQGTPTLVFLWGLLTRCRTKGPSFQTCL